MYDVPNFAFISKKIEKKRCKYTWTKKLFFEKSMVMILETNYRSITKMVGISLTGKFNLDDRITVKSSTDENHKVVNRPHFKLLSESAPFLPVTRFFLSLETLKRKGLKSYKRGAFLSIEFSSVTPVPLLIPLTILWIKHRRVIEKKTSQKSVPFIRTQGTLSYALVWKCCKNDSIAI